MTELKIREFGLYESKESLVDVWQTVEDNMHRSVIIPDTDGNNKVLSYEQIPGNYPQWSFLVFDSVTEYQDAIKDVDWIMDNVNSVELENIEELVKEEDITLTTEK